ncbi:MAG: YeeE/YedE thiosulfate transporter family protein [Thermodesulfobacteriota bacterium]|nr:YeeE/YedE thiosulfate transporter family protein [Thermodesulfobacteriota bacterium]
MTPKKYWSPYLAGVGLGLVLLAAFFIAGHGLGASGSMMRSVVAVEKVISQERVDSNKYLAGYGGGDTNPLYDWYIFELVGVLIGGVISGTLAGRMKKETNHGPRITKQKRWVFAVIGGALFGFGARLARGCTSGMALSGGAALSLGAWVTMMSIFAGAYILAFVFRKLWI